MSKTAWAWVLVIGCVSPAAAQESLLPTHVSDAGEVTITGQLRYLAGRGTLSNPIFEVDFDQTHFLGEFRVGVGVGGGFEIEGSFPFEFTGMGEADESGVEFELETAGLGDLTLEGNYLLAAASKTSPSIMAGLVVVLPVGNDDFAVPEIRFNGVLVQDGEEGGLGEGVVKVGLQFGVSQKVTGAEIYGIARYLASTGTQDEDDSEIDRPDVFTLAAGAMLPVGATSSLDLRLILNHVGEEIEDDDTAGESTEEAHLELFLDARLYFTVGSTASLVLGGTLGWTQDHAVDEEADLDFEGVFNYGVTLGLHLRLGVPLVGGGRK